nr:hypothetical protein GCM10020093_087980 [Planobispora longispora]
MSPSRGFCRTAPAPTGEIGAALVRSARVAYVRAMKGPYQVYFERARVPIVAVDGLGRIRESNPAFHAALGRDGAALLGRPAEELLAPGEREAQWPHWRLLATGRLDAYRTWMRLLRGTVPSSSPGSAPRSSRAATGCRGGRWRCWRRSPRRPRR